MAPLVIDYLTAPNIEGQQNETLCFGTTLNPKHLVPIRG